MTSSRFSDLSLDLKSLIISYSSSDKELGVADSDPIGNVKITRPTDLKSLCLTSRDIRDVAVRKLYRKVFLDVEGAKAVRVSGFLARDNPGIPHVRDVTVYFPTASNANERAAQLRQAHFVARMLLDSLPSNSLEAFRWRTWEPFSAENFFLLFKKQKHLQSVEIGETENNVMEGIRQNPEIFTSLHRVRVVELGPASVDALEVSQRLLQTVTKLDLLRICPAFDIIGTEAPNNAHDSSTEPGYISRTLFSHMRPFEKCTPLALKVLQLDRINLRYVSNSYMRVIDMPALDDLSIWECPGADALFSELSKPHLRPSHLKTLRFYHHDDDQHYGVGALESFLQSISRLVTLRIDISNTKEIPKDDCITKHSASLESLSIYASKTDTDVFQYGTGPLCRICSTCTGLRQLSIAPPPRSSLTANGGEDFETFLVSGEILLGLLVESTWSCSKLWFDTSTPLSPELDIYKNTGAASPFIDVTLPPDHTIQATLRPNQTLTSHQTSLSTLSHLRTLNLRAWPTFESNESLFDSYGGGLEPEVFPIYTHLLQRIAQRIFDRTNDPRTLSTPPPASSSMHHPKRTSKLNVVAFGSNGPSFYEPGNQLNMIPFVRGKVADAFGEEGMVAVRTKCHLVKFVEPECGVLNWSWQGEGQGGRIYDNV